jgi:hypothetical protein
MKYTDIDREFAKRFKDREGFRKWADENPGYLGGIAAAGVAAGYGIYTAFGLDRFITDPTGGLDFSGIGELLSEDIMGIAIWLAGIWLIPLITKALGKKLPLRSRRKDDDSVMLRSGEFKDF